MSEAPTARTTTHPAAPVRLPPNRFPRFYRGGPRITAFRGLPSDADDHLPEDWVGSTTTAYGETEVGLSHVGDITLREAIEGDPLGYLGPEHLERFGPDPRLLVKLLDAGERLAVHLHPDDDFAHAHLAAPCGKTEAWVFLDVEPGASMKLGFERPVTADELASWFDDQDAAAMLDAMRPIEVKAGDALFVPAGLPHAIGSGILLLELQQPTDLSLMLEWQGVPLGGAAPLLGLDTALGLTAVRRDALDDHELAELRARRGHRLFPERADEFFRAERVAPGDEADRGFAVVVAVDGAGSLDTEADGALELSRGQAALIPYASGAFSVSGTLEAYVCRPPAPR